MQRCPNCGEENPDRARFCLTCGTPLTGTVPRDQPEERKVVTILFCDLVGFTARSDNADPEDVRAALRPYHARLRKEIERFGGTVEKFIGDAVMAVFGAPVSHEDDAERAIHSALRITQAIGEMNDENPGLDLAVRIGINTGEAVVAIGARPEQGEGMVTGDVVNTTSRLQGAAPVGGILVGEATYRATREIFDYEPQDPVTVKGKAEPLAIWLAKAPRSRYGVDVDQDKPTPFIGRDDDVALLKQTYARALRDGAIQLVTVTGEPGVGKTRLLAEFRTFVDDQPELVYWRQGRCLPYGEGITFWALGEIVKGHAGILESDDPQTAGQKLDNAVASYVDDPTDRDWLHSRLSPLVGLSGEEAGSVEQEETFAAWQRFLEAVAAFRPLVLLFEDLHWADEAMLAFVEHLVDWSNVVPMLVVCTARPELFERHAGWGGGKRNSTTISLAPLTEEDTARLIGALLSQAVLPAETQATLLERAGGNPLYAEEFVKMLTDRGVLERRGRAWTVVEGADIPVPDTVQALIAARLDTLAPDRKALLQDAAVLGKVFWAGAVASMGGIDERAVRDAMHDLARSELVRPARRSSVQDQPEYSFWHLLVRDVAYAQIPRAARSKKHSAAAAWIEGIAGERVADHAELLAYHYEQALDLARASGGNGEAGQLVEAARRFLILAGDHAGELDMAKAVSYYRRALELTPPRHADRGRLLMKVAESSWDSRQLDAQSIDALFAEAIEELRAAGDLAGAGLAMVRRSHALWAEGDTARANVVIREAIDLLEPLGRTPELAEAYSRMTGSLMIGGQEREALEWAEKTISLAREIGADHIFARVLQFRGMATLAELGDRRGYDDLRESLRLCLELGLGRPAAVAYNNLADFISDDEGFARSYELYQEGIEFALRRGLSGAASWSRMEATFRLYEMGRWSEMLREEDEIIAADRGDGVGGQITVHALAFKALVLAMRGHLEEASDLMTEFVPRAREIGDLQPIWAALRTAAVIEQMRGDPVTGARLMHELLETFPGAFYAPLIPFAGRSFVAAGEVDHFADLVAGAKDPLELWKVAKKTGEAMVTEARGSFDEALHLYLEVAERWAGFKGVVEQAHALLGAGRCLVGLRRSTEATAQLTAAREIWMSLGAQPMIEEIDGLLQEATALTS